MSARTARFEVVHSDAGWFARFRAANGRIVFTSEVYKRRRTALTAIGILGAALGDGEAHFGADPVGEFDGVIASEAGAVGVDEVDERTPEATS